MTQQELQMLNDAYPRSSPRTESIRRTMMKFEGILARFGRREIFFTECNLTCGNTHSGLGIDVRGAPWLVECDVCVWEACFSRLEMVFAMDHYRAMVKRRRQ